MKIRNVAFMAASLLRLLGGKLAFSVPLKTIRMTGMVLETTSLSTW